MYMPSAPGTRGAGAAAGAAGAGAFAAAGGAVDRSVTGASRVAVMVQPESTSAAITAGRSHRLAVWLPPFKSVLLVINLSQV
jgi:hypothetical protein